MINILNVLWKRSQQAPDDTMWSALCPGYRCKGRLALWDDVEVPDGQTMWACLERGFMQGKDGVWTRERARDTRERDRGRALARLARQTGTAPLRRGATRGPQAEWGAIVRCPDCIGLARLVRPGP